MANGKCYAKICILPKVKETSLILIHFLPIIYRYHATSLKRENNYDNGISILFFRHAAVCRLQLHVNVMPCVDIFFFCSLKRRLMVIKDNPSMIWSRNNVLTHIFEFMR